MKSEIIVFLGYFVILFFVGLIFFFNGSNKGQKDYFLGGRSMGPWVTAMSAQASDMSAWLLMGLPGSILAFGFGQIWIGIGLALGTAANWIFCAKRLRKFSVAAGDSITVPQYLTNRFASQKKTLQIICAVIFLIAFTVYVASAFVAGASVFTMLFDNISEKTAMLVYALIIIGYTFLGGFKAVCWTDFFQGILMLIALLAVPIIIAATQDFDVGALSTVYQYTDANGVVTTCDFGAGLFSASWKDIVSGLGWGLGYFGMPHIIVRFMSLKSDEDLKKSAKIGITWNVLIVIFSVAAGCIGHLLLGDIEDSSTVFIQMVRMIFPAVISGILLSAILAASMSTADSQLLTSASAFASDVYKPVFRKNKASDSEMLWAGRIVVIAISVIALIIASNPNSGTVMSLVENAWGLFGAAFSPVIMLSLFWKRLNFEGALAGIITGAAVDIIWLAALSSTGIYEIIPGAIAGLIVTILVSNATKAPSKEVEQLFDDAVAYKD